MFFLNISVSSWVLNNFSFWRKKTTWEKKLEEHHANNKSKPKSDPIQWELSRIKSKTHRTITGTPIKIKKFLLNHPNVKYVRSLTKISLLVTQDHHWILSEGGSWETKVDLKVANGRVQGERLSGCVGGWSYVLVWQCFSCDRMREI